MYIVMVTISVRLSINMRFNNSQITMWKCKSNPVYEPVQHVYKDRRVLLHQRLNIYGDDFIVRLWLSEQK